MPVKDVTCHTMKLPTITLVAEIGLNGPHLIAWDRNGGHAGAAPLGDAISIKLRPGRASPWWIHSKDVDGEAIALPWCHIDLVKKVAQTFGILGDGINVEQCFYGWPAGRSLVKLVAADPQDARQWRQEDAYCRGWLAEAMGEVQQAAAAE